MRNEIEELVDLEYSPYSDHCDFLEIYGTDETCPTISAWEHRRRKHAPHYYELRGGSGMRKTKATITPDLSNRLLVNCFELMEMLGMGRAAAESVASKAHAIVHVGRLKRFHVGKIKE